MRGTPPAGRLVMYVVGIVPVGSFLLQLFLGFAEVGGALARLATEIAAEGGLVGEAEEAGNSLNAEVATGVEHRLH